MIENVALDGPTVVPWALVEVWSTWGSLYSALPSAPFSVCSYECPFRHDATRALIEKWVICIPSILLYVFMRIKSCLNTELLWYCFLIWFHTPSIWCIWVNKSNRNAEPSIQWWRPKNRLKYSMHSWNFYISHTFEFEGDKRRRTGVLYHQNPGVKQHLRELGAKVCMPG